MKRLRFEFLWIAHSDYYCFKEHCILQKSKFCKTAKIIRLLSTPQICRITTNFNKRILVKQFFFSYWSYILIFKCYFNKEIIILKILCNKSKKILWDYNNLQVFQDLISWFLKIKCIQNYYHSITIYEIWNLQHGVGFALSNYY